MKPLLTIREVLDHQRKTRPPDMEIGLQDFLELTPAEQMELLFIGLLMTVRDTEWAKNAITQIMKRRDE